MEYEKLIKNAFSGVEEIYPCSDHETVLRNVLERADNMDEQNITTKKKSRIKPILAGAAAAVAICGAGIFGIYLNATGSVPNPEVKMAGIGLNNYTEYDIVFGYTDAKHNLRAYPEGSYQGMDSEEFEEYEKMLDEHQFGGSYPVFGNPQNPGPMKNDTDAYHKTEHVYLALNDPLYLYVWGVVRDYIKSDTDPYRNNLVYMDYDVESDGKTLTVTFNNIGYPDGLDSEPVEFGHTFIFDIENASVNNMPTLDEESIALVEPMYELCGTTYEDAMKNFSEQYGYH